MITSVSGKNKGIIDVVQTFRSALFGKSCDLHYNNKEIFPETKGMEFDIGKESYYAIS